MDVPIVGVGILRPFTRITRLTRVLREISGKARIIKGFVWDVSDGEGYLGNGDVLRGDAVIITTGYWASTLGIPVMPFRGFGIRVRVCEA